MLSFFIPLLVSWKISSKCFDVMCYVIMILGLYHILKILCENSCEFNRQSIVLKTLNTEDARKFSRMVVFCVTDNKTG